MQSVENRFRAYSNSSPGVRFSLKARGLSLGIFALVKGHLPAKPLTLIPHQGSVVLAFTRIADQLHRSRPWF